MFDHSNLIVSAWKDSQLIGVCRCTIDWARSFHLSDLAVDPQHKQKGIGRRLIEIVKENAGEQSMILLLSVPTTTEYYPKVGFSKEDRSFILHRTT